MKIVRLGLTVVIALAAVMAMYSWCWRALECNRTIAAAEAATKRLLGAASPVAVMVVTRSNLAALESCDGVGPLRVDVPMLVAANHVLRSDWPSALEAYNAALRIDRRPEIYLSRGQVETELRDEAAAMRDFEAACRFALPMIEDIPEPLRSAVYQRLSDTNPAHRLRL